MEQRDGEVSSACPQCNGERVDVRVGTGTGELFAFAFDAATRPKGLKGMVGLVGVACTSCGLVQLYASEPERLSGS
jgi:hypothetical protein